jgi:hypothetical protein
MRGEIANLCLNVIARSDLSAVAQRAKAEATKQSSGCCIKLWIASRSLSSGAHSRDPLARYDDLNPLSLSSHLSSAEEGEALEQMHILLVLQQRAVQRRDQLARIALPQHFRRHVLVEQEF